MEVGRTARRVDRRVGRPVVYQLALMIRLRPAHRRTGIEEGRLDVAAIAAADRPQSGADIDHAADLAARHGGALAGGHPETVPLAFWERPGEPAPGKAGAVSGRAVSEAGTWSRAGFCPGRWRSGGSGLTSASTGKARAAEQAAGWEATAVPEQAGRLQGKTTREDPLAEGSDGSHLRSPRERQRTGTPKSIPSNRFPTAGVRRRHPRHLLAGEGVNRSYRRCRGLSRTCAPPWRIPADFLKFFIFEEDHSMRSARHHGRSMIVFLTERGSAVRSTAILAVSRELMRTAKAI